MVQHAMRVVLQFSECEHSGDLAYYVDELKLSGARILGSWLLESEYETGQVAIEVDDWQAFLAVYRGKDSAGFCDGYRPYDQ